MTGDDPQTDLRAERFGPLDQIRAELALGPTPAVGIRLSPAETVRARRKALDHDLNHPEPPLQAPGPADPDSGC